jgi:hypothetical protein
MKIAFFVVGLVILVIALLDEFNLPVEVPTTNNYANMAIGAGLMVVPWLPGLHKK